MSLDQLPQFTDFHWQVAQGGYRWESAAEVGKAIATKRSRTKTAKRGTSHTELFLVANEPGGEYSDAGVTDSLFLEFAEIPVTKEGILAFANRYGMLGLQQIVSSESFWDVSSPIKGNPFRPGEPLGCWAREIMDMHRLVRIWNPKLRRQTFGRFEEAIRWIPGVGIEYGTTTDHETRKEILRSAETRSGLPSDALSERVRQQIFRLCLVESVNEKLQQAGVQIALSADRHRARATLTMLPTSLKGFLWLQFAHAIDGNTRYRRCDDCGRWFSLGGREGRSDKRFCSGTCKSRAHRQLKRSRAAN